MEKGRRKSNTEALKKCYQGYKKDVRKIAADEKISLIKTGGGKPEPVTDPNFDLAISIMNEKTITGFDNMFDGDRAMLVDEVDEVMDFPCSSANINEENNNEIVKDWGSYKPSQLKQPVHPKLKTGHQEERASDKENNTTFESSDGIKKNTIPLSKGFKKQYTSTIEEKGNSSKWCERRRPVASTLPSTKITEQYSQLSAIKIELAKLQYETQKEEEAIQRKYSTSIEHELRKRSLELDVEIKTELLKKIKNDSVTVGEACSVLKNLENINPRSQN